MSYYRYRSYLFRLECLCLRLRPYATNRSRELAQRLMERSITSAEGMELIKRLTKKGYL